MAQFWQGLLYQPDCNMCPLRHDKMVLPCGPIPAKMCIVGEGPGYDEVVEGKGFVGRSGEVLWQLAAAGGVKRDDVWVTNAALCRPRDVRLQSGIIIQEKQVKELSVKACRKRLVYELLYVTGGDSVAVIMPVGRMALEQFVTDRKNMGIYKYRGAVMKVDLQKLWKQVSTTHQAGW